MTMPITPSLSEQQIVDYHEDGYMIIRNVLSATEANDLRRVVQEKVKRGAYPLKLSYPEPAKYTVSGNRLAEPGLTSISEHPTVIAAVESVLGQPAHLTAYVAYLRTPGLEVAGRRGMGRGKVGRLGYRRACRLFASTDQNAARAGGAVDVLHRRCRRRRWHLSNLWLFR